MRDTADFDVDRASVSTSVADRLLRAAVLAGRDAGEHPLEHDIGELVAISEMLVVTSGTSDSPSAVLPAGA